MLQKVRYGSGIRASRYAITGQKMMRFASCDVFFWRRFSCIVVQQQ